MEIHDLGLIDYQRALDLQRNYVDGLARHRQEECLLLCEHSPVLTLGRLADPSHILYSPQELAQQGIQVLPVDRGGEVTLHAPGQLVAYPILNLLDRGKNLHDYLYKLEQVGIDFLGHFGIMGDRFAGKTGVWIDDRKIMSIGIGVRKWVSYHGIGMNINTDLSFFGMIRPCGMDIRMTSLQQELGQEIKMKDVKECMVSAFKKEFGRQYV